MTMCVCVSTSVQKIFMDDGYPEHIYIKNVEYGILYCQAKFNELRYFSHRIRASEQLISTSTPSNLRLFASSLLSISSK